MTIPPISSFILRSIKSFQVVAALAAVTNTTKQELGSALDVGEHPGFHRHYLPVLEAHLVVGAAVGILG